MNRVNVYEIAFKLYVFRTFGVNRLQYMLLELAISGLHRLTTPVVVLVFDWLTLSAVAPIHVGMK